MSEQTVPGIGWTVLAESIDDSPTSTYCIHPSCVGHNLNMRTQSQYNYYLVSFISRTNIKLHTGARAFMEVF